MCPLVLSSLFNTSNTTELEVLGDLDKAVSRIPIIDLLRGRDGLPGRNGKDGEQGPRGERGMQGAQGPQGQGVQGSPTQGGVVAPAPLLLELNWSTLE